MSSWERKTTAITFQKEKEIIFSIRFVILGLFYKAALQFKGGLQSFWKGYDGTRAWLGSKQSYYRLQISSVGKVNYYQIQCVRFCSSARKAPLQRCRHTVYIKITFYQTSHFVFHVRYFTCSDTRLLALPVNRDHIVYLWVRWTWMLT